MSNVPNRSTRPRIPTPDVVTKEGTDRGMFNNHNNNPTPAGHSPVASGVALITQQVRMQALPFDQCTFTYLWP